MGDMHAARALLAAAEAQVAAPITFIFAGHLSRAHDIAHERSLRKGAWRYVTRLEEIQGYRGPESCLVIIAGSWYGRADADARILERLREADMRHEFVGRH